MLEGKIQVREAGDRMPPGVQSLEDLGTPSYNYLSGQKLRAKKLLQRKADTN